MLDLAREAAVQAFVREAIGRGLVASAQDVSGGGLAVALAECAMWGGLGASVRVAVGALAGGGPVRREPVAPRRDVPAALRRGARRCSPASTGCRSRRSARSAATASSSSSAAPGDGRRGRGPGRRRRRRPRGARRATSVTPGSTGSPAPSAGRAEPMCGVFGVVLPGRRADRRRLDRRARPVRAPAPRPGIGRAGGQRRRAADALQGPRA